MSRQHANMKRDLALMTEKAEQLKREKMDLEKLLDEAEKTVE
jgi:hypothetical protein